MTLKKIAIIPARSGSKGLPNKNILMLLDKPLLAYTIEAAINSKSFERVIVSTDSLEYKEIAEKYGAEVFIRPHELSTDSATSFMVIQNILQQIPQYNYFVLLQPTSPFRNKNHIKEAIQLFENKKDINFLVSVVESNKNADLIKEIDTDLRLKNFDLNFSNYRRQDFKSYTPNGAIFIAYNQNYLKKQHFFGADSIAYIMEKQDSIDIDDIIDFELAITIQTKKNKKIDLLKSIEKRIEEKKEQFSLALPITLIGHSIFDQWNILNLKNKPVNNLGISGINTLEYLNLIIKNQVIKEIGNTVFLLAGTNDIVLDNWTPQLTYEWIKEISVYLKKINPNVVIFLLSTPPVNGRIDRSNHTINNLNYFLKEKFSKIESAIKYVELSQSFYDNFGNLKSNFTYDGLHFSEQAYHQLNIELSELIK
ncbi:cytidylyltransferase domain-containing protein [Providencia sp. wls1916]|uniref:cytidylyltransferase domain-containing protein n=1 Tax=Providencia sp. wls1916 TaxID=2675155 RepID=UPI00139C0E72|nr:acylneuraminate cytidylyltransferase [Providencia sp. wls1916]